MDSATTQKKKKEVKMTKQTAVEWLINYIGKEEGAFTKGYILRLLEQAKEIDKEQKIIDYEMGYIRGGNQKSISGEQYYNQTYGGKND